MSINIHKCFDLQWFGGVFFIPVALSRFTWWGLAGGCRCMSTIFDRYVKKRKGAEEGAETDHQENRDQEGKGDVR